MGLASFNKARREKQRDAEVRAKQRKDQVAVKAIKPYAKANKPKEVNTNGD